MNKKGLIQVPNILIENIDVKPNTTYLYMMLKMKSQKQSNNTYLLNMYSDKFLEFIDWTQPTFKKHLKILSDMKIVLDYKLPKLKPMNINIESIPKKYYTQIDADSIHKILDTAYQIKVKKDDIRDYTEQAIRLFYYYEDRYNNDQGYAYPTYDQMTRECNISKSTITILNKYFKKQKILHIEHGTKWFVDDNGRPKKENNKYVPLCNGRIY